MIPGTMYSLLVLLLLPAAQSPQSIKEVDSLRPEIGVSPHEGLICMLLFPKPG